MGKTQTMAFATKVEAERHDAAMRADVSRGKYVNPNAGRIRLQKYAEQWAEAQTTDPSSRRVTETRLRLHILPELGHHELLALEKRPSIIQSWVRGLSNSLAPNYVRVIFQCLSTILQAALDEEHIQRNPCRLSSVNPPAPDRSRVIPWTPDRVVAVQAALPLSMQALVDIGVGLGLRQGEALGLGPDDVDWLRRVVHVRRQVKKLGGKLVFAPPKGNKERDVPLPDSVSLRLSAHLKRSSPVTATLPLREPGGKPITVSLFFASRNGNPVDRNNANRQWKHALVRAGILPAPRPGEWYKESRENGFHALRHTFASTLLHDGVDIRTLAAYLGHTDPGFTLRTYTHLMPSAPDRARKAVDQWFDGPRAVPILYPQDQLGA